MHTRVSAVCLLQSGTESSPNGEQVIVRPKLILNTHAAHPLPQWVRDNLI